MYLTLKPSIYPSIYRSIHPFTYLSAITTPVFPDLIVVVHRLRVESNVKLRLWGWHWTD
jgi:hypothetical protein